MGKAPDYSLIIINEENKGQVLFLPTKRQVLFLSTKGHVGLISCKFNVRFKVETPVIELAQNSSSNRLGHLHSSLYPSMESMSKSVLEIDVPYFSKERKGRWARVSMVLKGK